MLAVLMLHYGEAAVTAEAVSSVLDDLPYGSRLLLLDNGSGTTGSHNDDPFGGLPPSVVIRRVDTNLGFAAGMNLLIAQALADARVTEVLLLNNDTVVQPGCVERMLSKLAPAARCDMVAARLLVRAGDDAIDSLGIVLYRSGIASNRKREQERLLGPTGGCMLLTRRLLEEMRSVHGMWFDESFFCYAEDTDLVMRARWLGYESAYAPDAVVVHHGSMASGGAGNDFVLYHGIRNSIWALVRNAPATWLLLHAPWIAAAHGAILLRHLRRGRIGIVARLYRDAIRGLPAAWRMRRVIRRHRRVPARAWWGWIEPRFYERNYVRRAVRELFAR